MMSQLGIGAKVQIVMLFSPLGTKNITALEKTKQTCLSFKGLHVAVFLQTYFWKDFRESTHALHGYWAYFGQKHISQEKTLKSDHKTKKSKNLVR